jgi:hypothetical protein
MAGVVPTSVVCSLWVMSCDRSWERLACHRHEEERLPVGPPVIKPSTPTGSLDDVVPGRLCDRIPGIPSGCDAVSVLPGRSQPQPAHAALSLGYD